MQGALTRLFSVMPLIFGFGFVAPLIAQGMAAAGWDAPFGLERIVFGLIVGGTWGLYAQVRGRWL